VGGGGGSRETKGKRRGGERKRAAEKSSHSRVTREKQGRILLERDSGDDGLELH